MSFMNRLSCGCECRISPKKTAARGQNPPWPHTIGARHQFERGFPMRYSLLTSVAFAALIAAAPASSAFEIQPTNNNAGLGANIANNPDSQSDGMSANLSGNNGGNTPILHFGNSSLSINGGNGGSNSYGMSPAYREQFMGGPD